MSDPGPTIRQTIYDTFRKQVALIDELRTVRYRMPASDLSRGFIDRRDLPLAWVYDAEPEEYDLDRSTGQYWNALTVGVAVAFSYTHNVSNEDSTGLLRTGNRWIGRLLYTCLQDQTLLGLAISVTPVLSDINEFVEPEETGVVSALFRVEYWGPILTPYTQIVP